MDRLVSFGRAGPAGSLLYDDFEAGCYILRGLNATVDRRPFGRLEALPLVEPPAPGQPDPLSVQLDGNPPAELSDRYFLEYPPPSLWIFRLGFLLQSPAGDVPPAVLDASKHMLVYHTPRNDAERALWRHFRVATDIYAAVMLGCLIGLMAVIRWGYEPGGRLAGPIFLLLLPAALYFTANRFDVVPALLVALSYACLGRKHIVGAAVLLGFATMIKVYPVLLAPLVCAYLWPERRKIAVFATAFALTALVLLLPWMLRYGPETTLAPFRFQLLRLYQDSSGSFYDCILPASLAGPELGARLFRTGTEFLSVALFLWRRPVTMPGLLRASVVVLIVFLSLQVFYSPQWILWLSPLLIPLAERDRRIFWLYVALDLVIYWSFPMYDWQSPVTIWPRFGVMMALLAVLLSAQFRRPATHAERSSALEVVPV